MCNDMQPWNTIIQTPGRILRSIVYTKYRTLETRLADRGVFVYMFISMCVCLYVCVNFISVSQPALKFCALVLLMPSQRTMNPFQKIPMKLMSLTSKILSFSAVNWKLKYIREKLITRCLHFNYSALIIAITNSIYLSLAKYGKMKNKDP